MGWCAVTRTESLCFVVISVAISIYETTMSQCFALKTPPRSKGYQGTTGGAKDDAYDDSDAFSMSLSPLECVGDAAVSYVPCKQCIRRLSLGSLSRIWAGKIGSGQNMALEMKHGVWRDATIPMIMNRECGISSI